MKKLIFVFLVITLLIIINNISYAQHYEAKVESQYAKVYERANNDSKVLRTVTKGVELVVLEINDNWCFVSVKDNKGWILKSDITIFYNKIVGEYQAPEKVETKKVIVQENTSQKKEQIPNNYSISNRSPLRYGLKAGFSYARLIGDYINMDNSEYKFGFTAGGFMIYDITNNFAFQAEALYIKKGGKGPIESEDATINFDYMEIPILIRYQMDKTNTAFIVGGFAFAVNVNKSLVTPNKTYVFDDIKKLDYGLTIGIGYQHELIQGSPFHVELRYFHGLSTVNDSDNPVDVKNTNFTLTFGIEL